VARSRLAHILADGTLDPAFAPDLNSGVNSLARVGSVLCVGGSFTSVNSQARGRGVAFDIGFSSRYVTHPLSVSALAGTA